MLSDEEYTDIMEKVISSFYTIDSFNEDDYDSPEKEDQAFEKATATAILEKGYYHFTKQDQKLLEVYASKLFAPQYSKKDSYQLDLKSKYTGEKLYEVMLELAEYLGSYRYDKLHNIKSKEICKPRLMNKPQEEREESFIGHINALLDFIGRVEIRGAVERNALREELIKARNAPAEYVKSVELKTIKVTKDPIRQYLYRLNLAGKKETIDEFVSKIK